VDQSASKSVDKLTLQTLGAGKLPREQMYRNRRLDADIIKQALLQLQWDGEAITASYGFPPPIPARMGGGKP